jgi:hypothetical protein
MSLRRPGGEGRIDKERQPFSRILLSLLPALTDSFTVRAISPPARKAGEARISSSECDIERETKKEGKERWCRVLPPPFRGPSHSLLGWGASATNRFAKISPFSPWKEKSGSDNCHLHWGLRDEDKMIRGSDGALCSSPPPISTTK